MPLSEFEIIQHVFQQQQVNRDDVSLSIGDDAAVMAVPEGFELVVCMDTLISGVHFPVSMKPGDIGYRTLAVNISDLAAMGAEPAWVTLALTIPESNERWLKAFASGFFWLAEQHNVQLVGGDTTCGSLSITAQGHGLIPTGSRLTRSGAQPGDLIYVTGTLGDAAAGLHVWEQQGHSIEYLKQRLARPTPRVDTGLALRDVASSAIDISDGLVADLGHILSASRVGADIQLDNLPLSVALCDAVGLEEGTKLALTGGDDYELCFTVPVGRKVAVDELAKQVEVHQIGCIVEGEGVHFTSGGSPCEPDINDKGYRHF